MCLLSLVFRWITLKGSKSCSKWFDGGQISIPWRGPVLCGVQPMLLATEVQFRHQHTVDTFLKVAQQDNTFRYSMRVLLLLLLLGIVVVGVATESDDHTVAATLFPEREMILASSISIIASPSDYSLYRRLRRSSPSPTPSPTYAPSNIPTLLPIEDRTDIPSEGNSGYVSASHIYHTMWSFVCPLLSLSIMAWAVRRTSRRRFVCCGDVKDTVPGEIIVVEDDHSVAGDCSTDVELMPVSTNQSHEWTDCGADPMADTPTHGSYDWTSDDDSIHVTTFVRMKE
jgi:hypothetical protein